jgi:hypothetical protein
VESGAGGDGGVEEMVFATERFRGLGGADGSVALELDGVVIVTAGAGGIGRLGGGVGRTALTAVVAAGVFDELGEESVAAVRGRAAGTAGIVLGTTAAGATTVAAEDVSTFETIRDLRFC